MKIRERERTRVGREGEEASEKKKGKRYDVLNGERRKKEKERGEGLEAREMKIEERQESRVVPGEGERWRYRVKGDEHRGKKRAKREERRDKVVETNGTDGKKKAVGGRDVNRRKIEYRRSNGVGVEETSNATEKRQG